MPCWPTIATIQPVKFPEIIDDARRAVEWVHRNIGRYGGDPGKIFIMGHSAGAHLGAMLILDETYLDRDTYQAIQGFIGLSGPYDFLPHTEPYQYAVFGPETRYADSQPINFVDGTEPPLLLLYGDDDTQVKPRNIINLAEKIRAHGGPWKHIYTMASAMLKFCLPSLFRYNPAPQLLTISSIS